MLDHSDQPAEVQEPTKQKRRNVLGWTLVICVVVGFFAALGYFFFQQDDSGGESRATQGDSYIRIRGRTGGIPVAVSERAFNELASARTDRAISVMILAGDLFLVDNHTKVSVIGRKTGVRQVRILEGPMVGRVGWVPSEWVER